MPRVRYEAWKPRADALETIVKANAICAQYAAQGYDLTLRQLYYQFVARGYIPNNIKSYNRLGLTINKARLAGYMDWDYIVDRTRNLSGTPHWATPESAVKRAADRFRQDKWRKAPTRVEVWVEKEALAGIVGRTSSRHDVDFFSCRGYVSQSELWAASRRLLRYIINGQNVVVLHLGDHDPSGIDMTRDMLARLTTFTTQDYFNAHPKNFKVSNPKRTTIWQSMANKCGGRTPLEMRRIALNMDQVEEYEPPPNPAKITDSRAAGYMDIYGTDSWELDALEPQVLDALIEEHVLGERDDTIWDEAVEEERQHRETMLAVSERWADIKQLLETP